MSLSGGHELNEFACYSEHKHAYNLCTCIFFNSEPERFIFWCTKQLVRALVGIWV